MTPAEIRALRDAATQGPWQFNGSHFYGPDPERHLIGSMWGGGPFDANLALIAAAPTLATIAADALDEVARLRVYVMTLLLITDTINAKHFNMAQCDEIGRIRAALTDVTP